jgi:hypothetical protein
MQPSFVPESLAKPASQALGGVGLWATMEGGAMSHLVDKHLAERANAVWLSVLWSALAACVVGALLFDVVSWFGD